MRLHSKIILFIIFVSVMLWGGIFCLHSFNQNRIRIDEGLNHLINRGRILSEKCQTFNVQNALDMLGHNKWSGFSYHFDEELDRAEPVLSTKNDTIDSKKTSRNFQVDFTDPGAFTLSSPSNNNGKITNGVLSFTQVNDSYLEIDLPDQFEINNIGEIKIRLHVRYGKTMIFSWWTKSELLNRLTIYTFPSSDQFYVYSIQARDLFTNTRRIKPISDEPQSWKFRINASDVPGDHVEFDYIHFVSKQEQYSAKQYGKEYESIGHELRPVLFMNTPARLDYSLTFPDENLFFRVGLSSFDDPVHFRLRFSSDEVTRDIISEVVTNSGQWLDLKIDVSEWRNSETQVTFEATAENDRQVAFWSNPTVYSQPHERMNVIIVLEDALRADHLSLYGHTINTSPFKNKFFSNSILFRYAFSQATKTRPSCPTIMTSLLPTATGVWNFDEILADNYLTLAEIMKSQGFATASFCQNPNAGPGAGLHQGFEVVYDKRRIGTRAETAYGLLMDKWLEDNRDRNIFLYVHIVDPHSPYDPPPPFDNFFRAATPGSQPMEHNRYFDPDWIDKPTLESRRLLYDGEIAYNDHCFEQFINRIRSQGYLDNTLLLFISDHGEHLGEHDLWEHHPPGFIQTIHVPLVIHCPKFFSESAVFDQPVQLIDIMPTILDITGMNYDHLLIQGDSLLPLINGQKSQYFEERLIISEEVMERKGKSDRSEWGSLIYGKFHLINSKTFSPIENLPSHIFTRIYDYKSDPDENDLLLRFYWDPLLKTKMKNGIHELQNYTMQIWESLGHYPDHIIKYDPESLEQLKSLGYLQ